MKFLAALLPLLVAAAAVRGDSLRNPADADAAPNAEQQERELGGWAGGHHHHHHKPKPGPSCVWSKADTCPHGGRGHCDRDAWLCESWECRGRWHPHGCHHKPPVWDMPPFWDMPPVWDKPPIWDKPPAWDKPVPGEYCNDVIKPVQTVPNRDNTVDRAVSENANFYCSIFEDYYALEKCAYRRCGDPQGSRRDFRFNKTLWSQMDKGVCLLNQFHDDICPSVVSVACTCDADYTWDPINGDCDRNAGVPSDLDLVRYCENLLGRVYLPDPQEPTEVDPCVQGCTRYIAAEGHGCCPYDTHPCNECAAQDRECPAALCQYCSACCETCDAGPVNKNCPDFLFPEECLA